MVEEKLRRKNPVSLETEKDVLVNRVERLEIEKAGKLATN